MRLYFFALILFISHLSIAQFDTITVSGDSVLSIEKFEYSLEDLMSMKVYTASRKDETLFNTPISSCLITENEIHQHGFLTIPEALRLCPALMVREISNGNFDVCIRDAGYGLPRYQTSMTSKSLLLMIDNRIVFSYFEGGVFWPNLPIELNDVEKIEVAYGPNAALYGPNAVNGVINIITKKLNKEQETKCYSTFHLGSNTDMGTVHFSQKINQNLSIEFGLSSQRRNRYEATFYDDSKDIFVNSVAELSNPRITSRANLYFPEPKLALRKKSALTGLNFYKKEDLNANLSFGFNNNNFMNQYYVGNTLTPFSGESYFAHLNGVFKNFYYQLSNLRGRQNILGAFEYYNHDFINTDLHLDYNFKPHKNINIKTGVFYNSAIIDDRKYTINVNRLGAFNNSAKIENFSGFLKSEYMTKKIRLIGSMRLDRFNISDKSLPSYNFIINYLPSKNHHFRAGISRAYAGLFIVPSFINITIAGGTRSNRGNLNLENTVNNSLELGYKHQIVNAINVDFVVFKNSMTNFQASVRDSLFFNQFGPNLKQQFQNLPDELVQYGATIAINGYFLNKRITFRTHFTFQNSTLNNTSEYQIKSSSNPTKNLLNKQNIKNEASPEFWGGIYMFGRITKKLSISSNGYFFDRHRLTNTLQTTQQLLQTDPDLPRNVSINNISSKVIINLKLAYKLSNYLEIFTNLKNLGNATSRESFGTDTIGPLYLLGLDFRL
ncbi:MAG: TonB-dependent receptor plug domain-containing protein [Cytophagales bacterium]